MSRITDRFAALKAEGKTGFVAYITAGDPDLETTRGLVLELERQGADIVELGVPFSDPLADGPVNQASAQRALRHDVSMSDILDLVKGLRNDTNIPLVLFTYYNPIHRFGVERLVERAAAVGVDGVLALDLPPEEAGEFKRHMDKRGVDTIFLMTPTTRVDRIRLIASQTTGFVYYVSRTGVTGERESLSDTIAPMVECIREETDVPIAVGFGVSNSDQVREIGSLADGVVVGSAIVRRIGEGEGDPNLVNKIGEFVATLVEPLKENARGH